MALALFNDPFFINMERTFDRALSRAAGERGLLGDFPNLVGAVACANGAPGQLVASASYPMDIVETKEAYQVAADAPGMSHADIDVRVEDRVLTIQGKRRLESEEKDAAGHVVRRERRMTHFSRRLALPEDSNEDGITASLDKGVLTVTIPRVAPPPKPEPKRIAVGGAGGAPAALEGGAGGNHA